MGRGRKTKCTPELTQKICAIIAAGNYKEVAAAICDISTKTFYEWIQRGEKEQGSVYSEFGSAIKKAEVMNEARRVSNITKRAEEGIWQADAWVLERRYPERWGRTRHEITGKDGAPIELITKITIVYE